MLETYLPVIIGAVTFGGIVWANTAVLKSSLNGVNAKLISIEKELEKTSALYLVQVEHRGRMDRMGDTMAATGKRVDEQTARLNRYIDNKLFEHLDSKG